MKKKSDKDRKRSSGRATLRSIIIEGFVEITFEETLEVNQVVIWKKS